VPFGTGMSQHLSGALSSSCQIRGSQLIEKGIGKYWDGWNQ